MFYNRAELKREAKKAMSQSKASPYLVGLIFLIISLVASYLTFSLNFPKGTFKEFINGNIDSFVYAMQSSYETGFFAGLLSFLLKLMITVVSFGFMSFCMSVFRRQPNSTGMLFDGFGMFFKIVLLQIVTDIFIFLWSMLLIIPGIVAAYRYKLAPFLLIDNPHMGIMDCIRESKRLTMGYKGNLFTLDLSFILWMLLTALFFPVGIYVKPYYMTSLAGFYDMRLALDRQQNRDFVYTDESQNYGGFGD